MAKLERMPSFDSEDFGNDLLAAKERDLKPLREESAEALELDHEQTETMDDFLNLAWFSGTRSGHAQMHARATQPEPDIGAVAIERLESEFKLLMDESAEALNLTVSRTIVMWNYLHQAWMAGNRTCEAELMGLYVEMRTDVAAEALEWLEDDGRDEDDDAEEGAA
jgi:hypothetical protein